MHALESRVHAPAVSSSGRERVITPSSWGFGAVRKALAALLGIVFFVLFPVGLLALAVQSTFLSPDFYKSQLAKNDVYAQAYLLAWEAIGESNDFSRQLPLSSAEVEQVIRDVLPRDYLQRQTELAIDAVFAWLGSSDPMPQVSISLGEVKTRVPTALAAAAERKLASIPPCAPGAQPKLDGLPDCLPSGIGVGDLRAQVRAEVQRAGQQIAGQLPDTVSLSEVIGRGSREGAQIEDNLDAMKQAVADYRMASQMLYAALIVLLLFIAVLTYGPGGSSLNWVGAILLICAVVTLAMLLLGQYAGSAFFEESLAGELKEVPGPLGAVATTLFRSVISDFFARLDLEAGLAAAAGLLMLLVGRFA